MENTQQDANLSEEKLMKENLRVQKTAYIKQQMERQRAAEDARLDHLLQEQEIIDDLRESIDDSMWQTEEARNYNREFQERLNMQIYKAHGITGDKLTGMKEYKNALYRGAAAVLFLLSLALTVLCGVLHGFESDICLLMLACTAVEGTLAGKRHWSVLAVLCKILYILIFPAMMVMFVCYELGFGTYGQFLPWAVILGGLVTVLGTVSYFLHDPYRPERKRIQDARSQIRGIEKTAGREIRKNNRIREREERKERRKEQKRLKRENRGQLLIEGPERVGGFFERLNIKKRGGQSDGEEPGRAEIESADK